MNYNSEFVFCLTGKISFNKLRNLMRMTTIKMILSIWNLKSISLLTKITEQFHKTFYQNQGYFLNKTEMKN